ncbi:MAG: hypothetical protein E6K80_10890 [Candidatus Eisenbacteria bacterium]|uniref:Uncharacterized protein n=1 Tax=Eiseniibacteriota bacterium TaxID=2212470 RepID=A0A538U1K9_UNCEI|nr:MAG: hypothetical protein E6K80_10890 [Candidatus Eisenbacteria bacterium]
MGRWRHPVRRGPRALDLSGLVRPGSERRATGQEQHILPGSEFLTHTLTIKYAAGTLGNSECLAGAAIGVANLELQQPGTGAPTEIHQTTDVSNCCLFRSPSGETCPSATPTKRATWGSIKALYR